MSFINSQGEIIREGQKRQYSDDGNNQNENRTLHRKRTSYLKIFIPLIILAILSFAFLLNPTCEDFSEYLKNNQIAKHNNFWGGLSSKLRRSYCYHNMFFNTAKYNNEQYIGVFGKWFKNNSFINFDVFENNENYKMIERYILNYTKHITSMDDIEILITIYILIYGVWLAIPNFMLRNFTISQQNLKSGRLYTLVTSAFSHNEIMHLVMNILMLTSIGEFVKTKLNHNRYEFWLLYLVSALGGSIGSIVFHHRIRYQSMGASGALYGLYGYLAMCEQEQGGNLSVNWMGQQLNIAQALIVSLLFGVFMSKGMVHGTDSAMHLAGAVTGSLFPRILQALKR